MRKESREFLYRLLTNEQKAEYEYSRTGDQDTTILKELLKVELDIIKSEEQGMDRFVYLSIFQDTLKEYNIDAKDL